MKSKSNLLYKISLFTAVLFIFSFVSSHAQVCAIPGNDNDNLALSGTVNTYYGGAIGAYDATSTSIPLIGARGGAAIVVDDLVLVIQMQCADIDSDDDDGYGDGVVGDLDAFGSPVASGYIDPSGTCLAGEYEYVRASAGSSATTLNFPLGTLNNTYVRAVATTTVGRKTFQVIRVPQYDNVTLAGTVTTLEWNGVNGGIIALDVARTLDFSGQIIDVDGQGFRGGGGRSRSAVDANLTFVDNDDLKHASKGEGIAGTPQWVSEKRDPNTTVTAAITNLGTGDGYPDGTMSNANYARGAPANAGGGGAFWDGGTDNGGGGGGGNGGAGGRGGAGWKSAGYVGINVDYSNLPEKKWGFGGSTFSGASIARVVLGGGGGAGDNNNNSDDDQSSGAAGAGIVMIRARLVTGIGTITAIGAQAASNPENDGAGAGGAGGSVVIMTSDITGTITVNADGGIGGDSEPNGSAHAPGGGGGGGVVISSTPISGSLNTSVVGGANGVTDDTQGQPDGPAHGSKPGAVGIVSTTTLATDPNTNVGFQCLDFGDAPSSYLLADHNVGNTPDTLFLGAAQADGNPETLANIPSANADTDDLSDTDDEDGLTMPTSSSAAGVYTVTTTVFNNTGSTANLCGWVDFDQDGAFQTDESVCNTTVASTGISQAINLVFTVPIADRQNTGVIIGRYRLTTDTLTTSDSTGSASDGEVEDHIVSVTTLPVTINGFESHQTKQGLVVKWNTASETRNIGFNIWGESNEKGKGGYTQLTQYIIPSKSQGALDPQAYDILLPIEFLNYKGLAISAVDTQGNEELFGMYSVGQSYGRNNLPAKIDWQDIQLKSSQISTQVKNHKSLKNAQSAPLKAQLKTNNYGMHRVTYEELVNAGYDLQGINTNDIAITLENKAVARRIGKVQQSNIFMFTNSFETFNATLEGTNTGQFVHLKDETFGPNMFIDFWSQSSDFPDAEYINYYTYEISINNNFAIPIEIITLKNIGTVNSYQNKETLNEDNFYSFTNKSIDPWYAKQLKDFTNEEDKSYKAEFIVDANLVSNSPGLATIKLIGGADYPINPDHQVQIYFNNNLISTHDFDGLETIQLDIPLSPGRIIEGINTVEVKLSSGTQALYDLVLVDEVQLSYSKISSLENNILNIRDQQIDKNLSVNLSATTNNNEILAYSYNTNQSLRIHEFKLHSNNTATISNNLNSTDYWISTSDKLHSVSSITTIVENDLLVGVADFLIIAHPSFMPTINQPDHPLNRYIQHRQAQGWTIKTVAIDEIQTQYSAGMPLPGALTRYLKAANQDFEFSHVLLVGSDSYDYMNRLGLNSISFIPTKYAPTSFVPHTPSDQLLADLDNDGISDKAIGRWPVRTLSDLSSIVQKTIDWDTDSHIDAIFVTDGQDNNNSSFELQSQRLIDVFSANNWDSSKLIEIYTDEMDNSNGVSQEAQVRQQLFSHWGNNKSLTSFIGHGSPTQWSRSGILNANDIDELLNQTTPTLIGTLTCYTSYFVSPRTNTLSHRLLNGSNGLSNGAVAVHGASSLSSYASNELFAREILLQQLNGKTLGESILEARRQANNNGYYNQVINWILLGDPTVIINRD